ncbi:hypothetical protein FACS189440_10470 [Bacteroidia bacterium]|nr:hypothetical protein FACS189440_10470 [Bacteroidia bacterium]
MKKNKKIIIAFVAALLFSAMYAMLYKWWVTGNPFQASTVLFGINALLNVLILGSIAFNILRKGSTQPVTQLKKKIIPSFISFVLIALVISLSILSIVDYAYHLISGLDTTHYLKFLFQVEFPGAIKSFSIWILLMSAFVFYVIWRQAIEREQQLREENLKYKYKNLKTQVNPHFLFNSLNTLSEIIYADTKKADHYIQKLSGIYRYILDNEDTDLIPLNEELAFVNQYFDLQKERADDKIRLDIDFPNADKFKIIPVSLQILVENALKHNAASEENPLEIHVYKELEEVIVSNTLQRKNILDNSFGTGLTNLSERIKLITGKELIVSQENNLFLVKLPIVSI